MFKRIIILFLFLAIVFSARASHLIGGNFGYEYMGLQPNGKYRYKILLTTFVDCSPASEIPFPENPLKIGVYEHDLLSPQADKPRIDSLIVSLVHTEIYTPDLPPGCTVGQNTCIIRGDYEGYIDLSASVNGYHLYYERCCRNAAIVNVQPNQSAAFQAYIPPTSIVNSSPVFLYDPIPFLCINDPTVILNEAADPDGDSLVYSFSTAYTGFADVTMTLPPLPAPVLSWPVPEVVFIPGFSASLPFGSGGSATIDPSTGTAEYTIPIPAPHLICVEVREYRNGQLIGTIRRDLQLLALPCPYNPEPELVENLQVMYDAEVGDTLCFPITFEDPNDDSVFITLSGAVFDPLHVSPPATFNVTDTDSNRMSGNFCLILPCTGDTGIYTFLARADDNGCPPKAAWQPYEIRVHGPVKPEISGADTVCETTDSVFYSVNGPPGYQYTWQVINGSLVQQNGSGAVISWGSGTAGQVIVSALNHSGCFAGTDTLDVTLIPVPVLTAMPEDSVCEGDTLQLTAAGAGNFYWYPPQYLLDPFSSSPYTVTDTSRWYYVAGLPQHLCPPSDSVFITVWQAPQPFATPDSSVCRNDTLTLFAQGGTDYLWSPGTGLSDSAAASPWLIVTADAEYVVSVTDSNGCSSNDTVRIYMNQLPVISVDSVYHLCLGDTIQIIASGGVSYQWFPPDHLSSDSVADPYAFPPFTQVYRVEVADSNGCRADTVITAEVHPAPVVDFTAEAISASCEGFVYQMDNLSPGAISYLWNFGDGYTSLLEEPTHVYAFGQEYIITLTASNGYCDAVATDTVSIDELKEFIQFNELDVFTPEGDGINDILDFSLPFEFASCTKVFIYNRWGSLVFEADADTSWDGKAPSGGPAADGVYFWIIEVNGLLFKGTVSLLR